MERPAALEPRIHMPVFLRNRAAAKRPDSAVTARITQLNKYDRYLKLLRYNNDSWMRKRGKSSGAGFSVAQRQQLHGLFEALDSEGSGGLTQAELLEPLLALGLVQSREELAGFLQHIGLRGPVADYEELQALLERAKVTEPAVRRLAEVFLKPSYLPQKLRISSERRKTMLQAFTADSQKSRERGQNVLRYFAEEISTARPQVEKAEILQHKKLQRLKSLKRDSPNSSFSRGMSAATSRRRSPDRPSEAYRSDLSAQY